MLDQLAIALGKVRMALNPSKTIAITTNPGGRAVTVAGQKVRVVDRCVYLGQEVSLANDRFAGEIGRRIRAANFAFNRYRSLFTSRGVPIAIKRRLFNGAVLPALAYASETWSLTRRLENKLAVAQRKWERKMLGVTLLDHRTGEWLRDRTGLTDVVRYCRERRWKWASRVASLSGTRWTRALLEWHPRGPKRTQGRPAVRWRDDFVKECGPRFLQLATNPKEWKRRTQQALD